VCGISGLVSLRGEPVDPNVLVAMNTKLVHRGPDAHGMHVADCVGIAATRLAIIDLAGGDQPISNEDGTVTVVQNGEIYNHRDLQAQLERAGHRFRTRCDTEALVHLYEEHGPRFVEHLRGMFAIGLWDARRRLFLLARDRYGIKPLYYRLVGSTLSFASELKALLSQPGFSRELDLDALEGYLDSNAVPAPLSIFREARKLEAGHLLTCDLGGKQGAVSIERYARPEPAEESALLDGTGAELAIQLRERLDDSVRAHLIADVPVGVLLSGGIDSSALTALAAGASAKPVRTFSIGFAEESFNELEKARLVAQRYATDHHELVLRPNAVELLPQIVDAFDEPFADTSALPTYLVSRLAREHVKVVLSGEGGDELFGGYYTYVADLLAPKVAPVARLARPLVERLPSSSASLSLEFKAKRFTRAAHLPPLERHHGWKVIFSEDARHELLRSDRRGTIDPLGRYRARFAETEGAEPLARLLDVDFGIYLVDDLLVKTDRASMAHSLEARVPFLDPMVTELALRLPSRLKVRGLSKKRLLRQAVAPLLPAELLRAKKQGFSIPATAWLRGALEPMARETLSPNALRRQGFFDPAVVTRLIDDHVARRHDNSRQIWNLLVFALWFDRYAGAGSSPSASSGGSSPLPVAIR
jgi:asparagine synthase (glutamine-hydrolysing)